MTFKVPFLSDAQLESAAQRVSKCNAEGIHATLRSMIPVKAT